jgi:hypothetical protein
MTAKAAITVKLFIAELGTKKLLPQLRLAKAFPSAIALLR